jgi:hypothetical protein
MINVECIVMSGIICIPFPVCPEKRTKQAERAQQRKKHPPALSSDLSIRPSGMLSV